jgi:hypothetical protein
MRLSYSKLGDIKTINTRTGQSDRIRTQSNQNVSLLGTYSIQVLPHLQPFLAFGAGLYSNKKTSDATSQANGTSTFTNEIMLSTLGYGLNSTFGKVTTQLVYLQGFSHSVELNFLYNL